MTRHRSMTSFAGGARLDPRRLVFERIWIETLHVLFLLRRVAVETAHVPLLNELRRCAWNNFLRVEPLLALDVPRRVKHVNFAVRHRRQIVLHPTIAQRVIDTVFATVLDDVENVISPEFRCGGTSALI